MPQELQWNQEEERVVIKRILQLRDDQIAALPYVVGIKFDKKDIAKVIEDIRSNGAQSVNLDAILSEANSKEDVMWWVGFFEKHK